MSMSVDDLLSLNYPCFLIAKNYLKCNKKGNNDTFQFINIVMIFEDTRYDTIDNLNTYPKVVAHMIMYP
jgi:hypothetical protein